MAQVLRTLALLLAGLALAGTGVALPAAAEDTDPPGATGGTEPIEVVDDPALVTSPDGGTFIRDEWGAPPAVTASRVTTDGTALAAAEPTASYTLAETFTLHSRPGAARSVYLDFDGGNLLSTNSWLLNGLTTLLFPGWSLDGSSAFSDAERTLVQEVWARVAEDYAPFDVDVTTQEPAAGGLWRSGTSDTVYGSRVAFTSGSAVQSALCGGCGGLGWIGTFDAVTQGETRSPAWIFPSSLGNRAKSMAEAASHEVGHNLGLAHDGTTTSPYYGGGTLWGPLMGSPYSSGVTQWSQGDYTAASNHEDDVAVAGTNGITLRPDEAGSTPSTALPLAELPGGGGVITTRSDSDWIGIDHCAGTVTARADPAAVGPNLDVLLEVRNAAGAVLASAAPATARTTAGVTGLGASVSLPLTGGPFYVAVSGVGSGAGGTSGWSSGGYDDYGSLGTYRLSVTGCSSSLTDPPTDPPTDDPVVNDPPVVVPTVTRPGTTAAPRVGAGAPGGRLTIGVRWTAPTRTGGAPITGYVVAAYRLSSSGRVLAKVTSTVQSAGTRRIEMRLPTGRWVVRVKARNRIGWGALSNRSAAVRPC
ncbi:MULTISPECIES: zinc-dependent metalloprotease family protein [unclassified Nocardioides]|uniref:zinc-dependent metalloprotease family protein n=1 Tax=unclassified Nocardioides TaxID=2615069 RepID=UPI0006F1F286|nr:MULTISPECIES: zinc-dependent metalloprotease family protein [unclassified Nocardioides]KRA38172.1 hypothetical protein ASD81_05835 [Nocardioides sp. Root614]KRA92132.1 hypothetical protein ASD84_06100 [Nocardioides sp. Root682]